MNKRAIALSCMTNWQGNGDVHERIFVEFQTQVQERLQGLELSGELDVVYVHFEIDCRTIPGAIRGVSIGRYSKKTASIGAKIEVKADEMDGGNAGDLLRSRLLDVLTVIANRCAKNGLKTNLLEFTATLEAKH